MKKSILKTNCIIISIAFLLQIFGNPLTTRAGWHANPPQEKTSSTPLIIATVGAAALVTILIVSLSKKNKDKSKKHAWFQDPADGNEFSVTLPAEYKLSAWEKQQNNATNDFALHSLKSHSMNYFTSKTYPGFSTASFSEGKASKNPVTLGLN